MGRTSALLRALALGLAAGAASGAAAQTYPSALPLGGDAGAFESRLAGILDYSRTNEVTRFRLPSGRAVSVRSYQPTRIAGRGTCRGYRVDLSGEGGFMAVDGFRCSNGASWRLVEPETVLAQSTTRRFNNAAAESAPAPQDADPSRTDDEPLYGENDGTPLTLGPDGVPRDADGEPLVPQTAAQDVPLPRPRPAVPPQSQRADLAALAPAGDASAPDGGLPQGSTGSEGSEGSAGPEGAAPTAQGSASDADENGAATAPERAVLSPTPVPGEPAYVTQLRERIARARRLEEEVALAVRGNDTAPAPAVDETVDAAPDDAAGASELSRTAPSASPAEASPAETRTTAPAEPQTAALSPSNRTAVDAPAPDDEASAPAPPAERTVSPPAGTPPQASESADVRTVRDQAGLPAPARVVGERNASRPEGYAADRRIVSALQRLNYLTTGRQPSQAAVNSAVDEFATDERFALPIENDALVSRLEDALTRSSTLPRCASGAPSDGLCIASP